MEETKPIQTSTALLDSFSSWKTFLTYVREKWGHAGFQRYFRNTGWSFINKAFGMIIAFFVTAMVVRYLGPTKYGTLSYAISFVSLFSFISSLGIDQVLYRDLIKFPEREKEFLCTSFILRLIGGSVAALIVTMFTFIFIKEELEQKLILIISLSYIFQAFNIVVYAFQAKVQTKYVSYITMAVTIILSILKIAVVLSNKGILFFGAILVVEPILYTLFLLPTYSRFYGKITGWIFDIRTAKQIFHNPNYPKKLLSYQPLYYKHDNTPRGQN